jgi:hypothetical protein
MKTASTFLSSLVALGLAAGAGAQTTATAAQDAQKAAQDAHATAKAAEQAAREQQAKARTWARHADQQGGEPFTDRMVRTFKAGPGTTVVLANVAGDIVVTAGGSGEVRLEAVKRTRATSEAAARPQLDATRIDVSEQANRIEVRAVYPDRKTRVAVDYTVTAPAGITVDVRSVSGDISITGIRGEVRVESVSGDVTATGLAREAVLKAVSGDVVVSASEVDGEVSANSVSGDVTVKSFKARSVKAATVSGNVSMQTGACDRASVGSVSGNVELAGTLARGGRYDLKSHSGNVRLALDGKTGFVLDASSFSGNITTDLPLDVKHRSDGATYGPPNRSLRAVFQDGSAQVELTSFSGNVVVVKTR